MHSLTLKTLTGPAFWLLLAFVLTGCIDERTTIHLNPEGGGQIKQTLIISERMLIGFSDDDAASPNFPLEKAKLLEALGDTFSEVSVTVEDHDDGSKRIAWSGSFASTEEFFNNSHIRESLNLRVQRSGDDAVEVSWRTDGSDDGAMNAPSLNQQYGLLHGAVRQLTLQIGDSPQVEWTFDLRDRTGLEATRAWLDSFDEDPSVILATADIGWDWDRHDDTVAASEAATQRTSIPSTEIAGEPVDGLTLVPHSLAWNRSLNFGESTHRQANLTLRLALETPDDPPLAYYPFEIESAEDDTGRSLVPNSQFRSRQKFHPSVRPQMTLDSPAPEATAIWNIRAELPLVTALETETVELTDLTPNAESTGIEALDTIDFQILSIRNRSLQFTSRKSGTFFQAISIHTPSGEEITSRGTGGTTMGDNHRLTVNFSGPIPDDASLRLVLLSEETIVRVPLVIEELELP